MFVDSSLGSLAINTPDAFSTHGLDKAQDHSKPKTIRLTFVQPWPQYEVHIHTHSSTTTTDTAGLTHTLASELALLSSQTITLAFTDWACLSHYLRLQIPHTHVEQITKVQWEVHNSTAILSASTLWSSKQLVESLPGLHEVTIVVVLKRREEEGILEDWVSGLRTLKKGLDVRVK